MSTDITRPRCKAVVYDNVHRNSAPCSRFAGKGMMGCFCTQHSTKLDLQRQYECIRADASKPKQRALDCVRRIELLNAQRDELDRQISLFTNNMIAYERKAEQQDAYLQQIREQYKLDENGKPVHEVQS